MIDRIFVAPKDSALEEGLAFARAHHLDYEISLGDAGEFWTHTDAVVDRYRTALKGFSGLLSMQSPVVDINVVSPDPEIARISRERCVQTIEIAKLLGVRYLVMPSQWTPLYPVTSSLKSWLARLTDFWEETIAEHLEGTPMAIVLENMMEPTPEHLITLLSRVNSSHLRAGVDTGHVNIFSSCSPMDWLRELGSQVAYIHAHNNAGDVDSHLAFDKGLIDMDSFLNHLALLPQKVHLSIATASMESLESSYAQLAPHLQLQKEQGSSKSFLI